MSDSTVMSLRLPSALHRKLARLAKQEQRSNSWLAAEAIRQYVDLREAHLAEIEVGLRSLEKEPTNSLAEAKKHLKTSRRKRT